MSILTTNGITLLHDDNILNPRLCDAIRNYIDKQDQLDSTSIQQDSHVQCLEKQVFKKDPFYPEITEVFLRLRTFIKSFLDLKVMGNSGYTLRKIHSTTRLHADGTTDDIYVRILSCIVALNSDYGGGEITFPKQDFKTVMEKGDIILFPPYWTHPHMVFPPHRGTNRYTINTWLYDGSLMESWKPKKNKNSNHNIY